jgi:dolichol kinase
MEAAVRASLAVVCYAVALLVFFHLLRKRAGRWVAVLLSVFLAVPCVLPLYHLSPQLYLQETRGLLTEMQGKWPQILGGVLIACLILPVCYRALPREYVQFWKIFGPPSGYQYRYVAVGQVAVGAVAAYFIWVGTDTALLFLSLCFSALAVAEYSRTRPLSKPVVSGVVQEWVEPATLGRWRIYLPGFLFLLGCACVVLLAPEFALPSVLLLSVSDPVASLAGRRFGHHGLPYHRRKTLEGSLCFLAASLCILALFRLALPSLLLVSVGVALVESVSPSGVDNLSVPLSAALLLRYLVGGS